MLLSKADMIWHRVSSSQAVRYSTARVDARWCAESAGNKITVTIAQSILDTDLGTGRGLKIEAGHLATWATGGKPSTTSLLTKIAETYLFIPIFIFFCAFPVCYHVMTLLEDELLYSLCY